MSSQLILKLLVEREIAQGRFHRDPAKDQRRTTAYRDPTRLQSKWSTLMYTFMIQW